MSNKISSYCVYFPQFHEIIENNKSFYKGYTDIVNLNLLNKNNENIETPSMKHLGLKNILDYDLLKNEGLIQKQIDIITEYGINGFAIYYYWFSTNTITGDNMIMKEVIDKFFNDTLKMKQRKVFFIWANENWSDNPAFGESKDNIENVYDEVEINKNMNNLLTYFKQDNYLKIDNKPVFLIHHPWFIKSNELDLLYKLLNKGCIENGLDGIHMIVNAMNGKYAYKQYDFHPNYKRPPRGSMYKREHAYLDYEKYTSTVNLDNNIQTLFFDFDNRARLIKPDRRKLATMCVKNSEENQCKFIKKVVDSYKNSDSDIDNILLINAWNEWGEKMHIEPSEQRGCKYLELIRQYIKN